MITAEEIKRISHTEIEIDGEIYIKAYKSSCENEDTNSIFSKIKSYQDAENFLTKYNGKLKIYHRVNNLLVHSEKRTKQLEAFAKLSVFADVINEGKERDKSGFRCYVYYDENHKEFYICEHTYSLRHTIYFAGRELAQYSINCCRQLWLEYYGIE